MGVSSISGHKLAIHLWNKQTQVRRTEIHSYSQFQVLHDFNFWDRMIQTPGSLFQLKQEPDPCSRVLQALCERKT